MGLMGGVGGVTHVGYLRAHGKRSCSCTALSWPASPSPLTKVSGGFSLDVACESVRETPSCTGAEKKCSSFPAAASGPLANKAFAMWAGGSPGVNGRHHQR